MLHRPDFIPEPAAPAESTWPATDEAFQLEPQPWGVRFYVGRESFFHPYHQLANLHLTPAEPDETLTLAYAGLDVVLSGHGLHALFVPLARQRVAVIVQQPAHHAAQADATCVTRMDFLPRAK